MSRGFLIAALVFGAGCESADEAGEDTGAPSQSGGDGSGGDGSGGDGGDGGAADCEATIPADASVIRGEEALNTEGAVVWACAGSWVTVNSADATLFVEADANITVNGQGAELWVKEGGSVAIYGGGAEVWYERSTDVSDQSYRAELTTCGQIAFVGGPAEGC